MDDEKIMLYKSPGSHFGINGGTFDFTVCDAKEKEAFLEKGWAVSLEDAMLKLSKRTKEAVVSDDEKQKKPVQENKPVQEKLSAQDGK